VLSAAAGETAVFLEATAFFALAVAAVHGVPAENRERRRALVLAVLVGDDSKHAIAELIGPGRTSGAWLSEGVATLPMPALSQLNSRLLKYAVKRYTVRRGALLFGKMLPIGIGAIVGAVGNRAVGKKIVRNARRAFGSPPPRWPASLHLLPTVHDAG
jgi:F0F1-type ATP synthase membrane subunit c/vacuolar-type H+-ATPase subunit K